VVSDIAAGTAFRELVGSNMGEARGIIQFSNGLEPRIGSDSRTVKFQAGLGVELEP